MVSKDQAIGWLIFSACLIVGIGYLAALFAFPAIQFWLIAIPVVLAFLLVVAIGAWIGWTMATTPPPKPIEEAEEKTGERSRSEGSNKE